MASFTQTLVWGGWFIAMPLMFFVLAGLGWRRDRVSAAVLAAVALGFALQVSAVLTGWPSRMLSPAAVAGLAILALAAFAFRLWRDRRLRHRRSTYESLAVLTIGAVFLLAVLALPGL